MSYIPHGNRVLYQDYQTTLANGAELDTGWMDISIVDKISLFGMSSTSGMQYIQQYRSDDTDTNAAYIPITVDNRSYVSFANSPGTTQARFRWKNITGAEVSGVSLTVKASYGSSDKTQVVALDETIIDAQSAEVMQAIQRGKQPDGDYVAVPADGSAFSTSGLLVAHEVYTGPWVDTDGWNCIELFVSADVQSSGQGIIVQYSDDIQGAQIVRGQTFLELNQSAISHGFQVFNIPPILDGFRVLYVNNSQDQNEFYLDATLKVNRDTTNYNEGGGLVVADFATEVALHQVPNYDIDTKFGRNGEIGTATTPEDVWIGGGIYTGFNPAVNGGEAIQISSDSVEDAGTLVAAGTSTAGNETYIEDTGVDFTASGVAIGDLLINDSRGSHGVITAVSATRIDVWRMSNIQNGVNDVYRIATTNGTGTAVVKVKKALRNNFDGEYTEYIIMNGVTPVDTIGTTYIRCSRCSAILSGSTESNVGNITGAQTTTTANVFFIIDPTNGQTLQAVATVPAGQTWLVKSIRSAITRLSGAGGSANVIAQAKLYGESWQTLRSFELQTGANLDLRFMGGVAFPEGTDMRVRVIDVSDNGTVIDAAWEYMIIKDTHH